MLDIMNSMHLGGLSRRTNIILTLVVMSLVSFGFLGVSIVHNRSLADTYLGWNLLLAWLPVILAFAIVSSLEKYPWLSWRPLVLTMVWVALLPNSFYLISDLIHLPEVLSQNLIYDSAMFELFILNGLALGCFSLFLIHRELSKRINNISALALVLFTLLLCSFAIYLGRDLRWSSWDLLSNPAGILFDIANPLVSPSHHFDAYTTTLIFFPLLSTIYCGAWRLSFIITPKTKQKS